MTFSLIGSVASVIILILTTIGLTGVFLLMVVESFGIPPVPSEIILPFTGFLIATSVFPLVPAMLLAIVGGVVGSFAAYAVGRWWRSRIVGLGLGPIRLEERHLARVDRWFALHGESTVAVARLMPIVRSYISYPAGSARMSPVRFGVFTLIGTTPFTVGLIYAGMLLGAHWSQVEADFRFLDYVAVALIVAVVVYFAVLYLRRPRSPPEPTPGSTTTDAPTAPRRP